MIPFIPNCLRCRHLTQVGIKPLKQPNLCKAFPDEPGIPKDIWDNQVEHTFRQPGQTNDFVFKPKGED